MKYYLPVNSLLSTGFMIHCLDLIWTTCSVRLFTTRVSYHSQPAGAFPDFFFTHQPRQCLYSPFFISGKLQISLLTEHTQRTQPADSAAACEKNPLLTVYPYSPHLKGKHGNAPVETEFKLRSAQPILTMRMKAGSALLSQ